MRLCFGLDSVMKFVRNVYLYGSNSVYNNWDSNGHTRKELLFYLAVYFDHSLSMARVDLVAAVSAKSDPGNKAHMLKNYTYLTQVSNDHYNLSFHCTDYSR